MAKVNVPERIEELLQTAVSKKRNINTSDIKNLTSSLKAYKETRAGILPILKTVGLATGIGGGLALGAYGVGSAYDALHRVATKRRNLKRMYEEFPELKKKPVQSEKAFGILHQYAPELTKSPQVAGSWVKKVIEYPEAGVSPTSIRDIIEAQRALAEARTTAGTIGGVLRGIADPGTRMTLTELAG